MLWKVYTQSEHLTPQRPAGLSDRHRLSDPDAKYMYSVSALHVRKALTVRGPSEVVLIFQGFGKEFLLWQKHAVQAFRFKQPATWPSLAMRKQSEGRWFNGSNAASALIFCIVWNGTPELFVFATKGILYGILEKFP